jgi:hypothetical protein
LRPSAEIATASFKAARRRDVDLARRSLSPGVTPPTHGLRAFLTTLVVGGLAAVGIHRLGGQAMVELSGPKCDRRPGSNIWSASLPCTRRASSRARSFSAGKGRVLAQPSE